MDPSLTLTTKARPSKPKNIHLDLIRQVIVVIIGVYVHVVLIVLLHQPCRNGEGSHAVAFIDMYLKLHIKTYTSNPSIHTQKHACIRADPCLHYPIKDGQNQADMHPHNSYNYPQHAHVTTTDH